MFQDLLSNIKKLNPTQGSLISYLLRTCHTAMNCANVDFSHFWKKAFYFSSDEEWGGIGDLFDGSGLLLVIYKHLQAEHMTYLAHTFSFICN